MAPLEPQRPGRIRHPELIPLQLRDSVSRSNASTRALSGPKPALSVRKCPDPESQTKTATRLASTTDRADGGDSVIRRLIFGVIDPPVGTGCAPVRVGGMLFETSYSGDHWQRAGPRAKAARGSLS